MLLTLSETYAETVSLMTEGQVTCDISLSSQLCNDSPDESGRIFHWLIEKLTPMWHHLAAEIPENPWIQQVQAGKQRLDFSVILVTNSEIHTLNRTFRAKDSPTDVLTFSLLEESSEGVALSQLPELSLGEIYISLTWAQEVLCNETAMNSEKPLNFFERLTLYVLERLIHGCLHLLGVHHETMPDYNKVVAIQRKVIHAIT